MLLRMLILLLSIMVSFAARGATVAEEMKALVEGNKPAEAYSLGLRHADQLGNPDFDFFFGVAAVDAGHTGHGVLALERYLLNFPENNRARLELARGYFVLGEDARAHEEFESIRAKKPPPEIVATIDSYLDAIRARQGRYQTTSRIYIETGLGFDSNVNSGVSSSVINLPTLGNVLVSATGTKMGDSFAHLAAGAQITKPVAPGVSVFFGGDVALKNNFNDTAFSQTTAGIAGGGTLLRDENIYRGTLSYGRAIVENDIYRDVTGGSVDWIRQLNPRQALSASLSHARLDYTGANSVRNSEVSGVGAGFRHALVGNWQPVLTVGASYAEERNQVARNDLGRDLYGLSAQINFSPGPKWGVNLGYTLNQSRYSAPDQLLLSTRRDDYHALEATVIHLVDRSLSVRAELLLARNDSNIALYDFKRHVTALKVRYEWK
ncbi:MAG: hypothetical protein ACO3IW_08555 [Burkholderiales bacterium]